MRIQWSDLKTFDIIGSGSFGRVFHGDLLGTEVAIKECVRSNSRAFDEKYFKREVDILKQSRHPNIVQFMGICKRKKKFYIITEFLPLGNLRRWIQDETKEFGWDTRISFAIDISLALAYLHHKNIIHRDLKGENLLISENMRVKVCDFGFSRLEARDDDEMRRISYCGTDGYMAPEILLGEDFDCSVDVFSFGVVLAEMMARHVVDPQHFQRVSPDMGISSDEILFRAQTGCPLELGELAIHCVQPLPQHRPKLREVVERLTAIESVDVHVGTTLIVAPSVARAARNIMRKREQQQHQKGLYQLDQSSPDTNSSVCGNAHTWRMTDQENASSRRIDSSVVGSTSTYKGNRWTENQAHQFQTGSSAIPLVLENRRQDKDGNHDYEGQVAITSENPCQRDDDTTFRMPLWDSINSPQNQEVLRQWHESASVDISTVDGEGNIQSWSQERLSSIQCNLDDDSDSDYSLGSDDTDEEGGGNDEYIDSLLNEDSDDEIGDSEGQSIEMYELSSDSDESLSSGSLTESVVMALDNLEIPDLMTTLPEKNPPVESQAPLPPATTERAHSGPENGNDKVNLFRKPSLISRLLPPIPTSENPWKADEAIQDLQAQGNSESAGRAADRTMAYATTVEVLLPPQKLYSNDNQMTGTDPSTPPPPPSKSSILLRTNTVKSLHQPPSNPDSTPHQNVDSGNLDSETIGSASNSTATSKSSSSSPSLSSASSNSEDPKLDGNHAAGGAPTGTHNRGPGLIRGMSDSALESASNAIGAGGTIAGNIIAAMGAKTWTSGTGGFGQWIGHHTQHDDESGETKLKKHTSLKEGKQQRALASRLSKLDGLGVQEVENEEIEANDVGQPDPSPIVKRRAQKPLTGFPHRFSLVVFSTQLLPRCDACQKRLGVLPGWASKHLECDDCGYKTHPKCVPNVAKNCTSARKSGVWEIPV